MNTAEYKKYRCLECEHSYDEGQGGSDNSLALGAFWKDISEDWSALCVER